MRGREAVYSAQTDYQRRAYESHFPKRAAAVRSQLAHPLFRSFNDRVAGRILDAAGAGGGAPGPRQGPVRVFEPGCGEGLLGSALERVAAERRVDMSYIGADLSPAALDLARSAVSGELRVGDAAEVAGALPAASQDVVVAKNLLHHLPDPTGFLRQVGRVLAPHGTVIAFEPRLGCPQFLLFNILAARRERHFFQGQRRNAAAFRDAGYRVLSCELFSWLPYELAFVIRQDWFRRLFDTSDPKVVARVSEIDDRLARALPWLACYAVWLATPQTPRPGPDGS
ncbi:MAG TPA: class I SAM-dependent methyltransferase [Acidimicrobiales bacterium]|nr:class I SAM-dependent methyltransferase [Acidimicrobiales bacterium]